MHLLNTESALYGSRTEKGVVIRNLQCHKGTADLIKCDIAVSGPHMQPRKPFAGQ